MSADHNEVFERLPPLIRSATGEGDANEPVTFYRGDFELALATGRLPVKGELYFSWRPRPGVRLRGEIDRYTFDFNIERILIPDRHLEHGAAFITYLGGSDGSLSGLVNNPVVLNWRQNADRLTFALPNFREVLGLPVRTEERVYAHRILLEDANWVIHIDRQPGAEMLKKQLKQEGGYALTCAGEARSKTGLFTSDASSKLISDLGLFLTFLNGRRCFPCLIKAYERDALSWEDYSAYHADEYKEEYSWLPQLYAPHISTLWQDFTAMTQKAEDRECLDLLIHWYVEANNNSGFAEGSIVFMQNAFELMYNWQIGKPPKGQKVDAAGKLRALLIRADIDVQVPAAYRRITADL
ncbi:hypothetical protein MTO98_23705 [Mucilaginibacter sp. SMC90]|uniref:hypothetical protein n=1 Tax=Mucilaginibacter sp. SMC90 TaxID=2929803 RepID=UPI001FB446D1|nr:hypothetical protein [Mucilaginibacter sp. SMC90]UOE47416.1 hypothetical protein MTO98_23705 [Mucilaginibacter sp. SMC90]